ncbi:MAG: hypothetical protein IID46_07965 [Planctomycetes bacterium]|nr:hypothetical protein [Planctomycetota bacterium]
MNRKRLGMMAMCLLLAVGGAAGALLWALTRVPDFYVQALSVEVDPAIRKQSAEEFVANTIQLVQDIEHEPEWSHEFTQDQINSWIVEELHQKYARHVPEGVSEPRVRFENGLIFVGFRYNRKGINGVVSFQARPWVSGPNQLALEIESVRAGVVPIPLDKIIDKVSQHLASKGWLIEWTQSDEGNDIAILHLDPHGQAEAVLETLEVIDGAIRMSGKGKAKYVPDTDDSDRKNAHSETNEKVRR